MLKDLWVEYWWIPVMLVYAVLMVILALALAGRGMFETTWPKIGIAATCVTILLIPTMHSPASYINAVAAVFSVVVFFRILFKRAFPESGDPDPTAETPPRHSRS